MRFGVRKLVKVAKVGTKIGSMVGVPGAGAADTLLGMVPEGGPMPPNPPYPRGTRGARRSAPPQGRQRRAAPPPQHVPQPQGQVARAGNQQPPEPYYENHQGDQAGYGPGQQAQQPYGGENDSPGGPVGEELHESDSTRWIHCGDAVIRLDQIQGLRMSARGVTTVYTLDNSKYVVQADMEDIVRQLTE